MAGWLIYLAHAPWHFGALFLVFALFHATPRALAKWGGQSGNSKFWLNLLYFQRHTTTKKVARSAGNIAGKAGPVTPPPSSRRDCTWPFLCLLARLACFLCGHLPHNLVLWGSNHKQLENSDLVDVGMPLFPRQGGPPEKMVPLGVLLK